MPRHFSPDAPAPRWRAAALAGKLLLAGVIIAFELMVLGWIARPKVGDDYRRRFIDKTSGCWAPPGYDRVVARQPRPLVIDPARTDNATLCVYLPDGWSQPEEIGIWSIGRHAVIMAPISPQGGRIRLSFVAPGYLPMPQEFVIRQGAARLYAGSLEAKQEGVVTIAPDASLRDANGFVRLDLEIAHPMSPRAADWRRFDTRLLGLRLTRIEMLGS